MNTRINFRSIMKSWSLLLLVFALAACASNAAQQPAEVPATAVSVEQSAESSSTPEPEPTQALTNTTKPTPVPPTPTPEPEPTQAPTNTPIPTAVPPTPTPQPEPLALIAQGFGQERESVGFGFLVENKNPGFAFEGTEFTIAAYDASGNLVSKNPEDHRAVGVIMPNQTLGFAGNFLVTEGSIVEKIEIELFDGDAVPSEMTSDLSGAMGRYFPAINEYSYSTVTGVVTNQADRMYEGVIVSAIAYNEAGDIIGGGATHQNFVPAAGVIGIKIGIFPTTGIPVRVELYPTIYYYDVSDVVVDTQSLTLVKQGFGQDDAGNVGFAALVKNNSDVSEDVQIHVSFFAEDGSVVAVGSLWGGIPAGQTMGLANDLDLPEGTRVARADFLLWSLNFSTPTEYLYFPAEVTLAEQNQSMITIKSKVTNAAAEEMKNVLVMVVIFNAAGEIIGGGQEYVNLLAKETKERNFTLYALDTFTTVEIYAMKRKDQ